MPNRSLSLHRLAFCGLIIGTVALFGWSARGVAGSTNHPVTIANFAFQPATLTIAVGDSVTWTNADSTDHTATSSNAVWDTGHISTNGSAGFTFTAAGTYAYFCSRHPNMTASITVADPAAPTPTTPPTATLLPTSIATPQSYLPAVRK